jgi:hypothetical protein
MLRQRVRCVLLLAAGLVLAGTAGAADEATKTDDAKKPKLAPHGFLARYLTPQMDSGLNAEVQAAANFTNPSANPWTKDDHTVSRVEKSAIRASTGALKRYAIESLGIDRWSIPLFGAKATGVDALKTDSGGTRLRFGFSHLAPRADVLFPVDAGHVAFSADALGRLSTSFETPSSRFRVGASVDPRAHQGGFSFSCSF